MVGARGTRPQSKFLFIFMQFSAQNRQNNRLAPPMGNPGSATVYEHSVGKLNVRVGRETVTPEGSEPIHTRRVVAARTRGTFVYLRFTQLTYNNNASMATLLVHNTSVDPGFVVN